MKLDVQCIHDDGWRVIAAKKNPGHEMFFSHLESIDIVLFDEQSSRVIASVDPHRDIIEWKTREKGNIKLIGRASDESMTVLWSFDVAL